MALTWRTDEKTVDWEELSELYRIAPFGIKEPDRLKVVFENSRFSCFVYDADKLVGAGRALADGFDCSYICDVAVHPKYQGLGLGKKIVTSLMERSREHRKILLYANPWKEGFYAKLGFKKMKTAMAIFENETEMVSNGTLSEE